MNDKRIPLQGNLDTWWNMWTHWQFMYRVVGEDRMHNLTYIWECDKAAHRNDWALAMCYYRIAMDRFAQRDTYFEGGDAKLSDRIPVAPYRTQDGRAENTLQLTMPEVKTDDWRWNNL